MRKIRTIIVEDEPIIAADLQNQLHKIGYEVAAIFEDGESLIHYLKNSEPIDLILMDIQLEGKMDGVETAKAINTEHNIPIIYITSNTDAVSFQRAKLTRPSAFLSKPFRIRDIISAIELALETPKPAALDKLEFMNDRIFLKTKNSMDKVMYDNILYVEANGSYSKIYTTDRDYVISQSLTKTEKSLQWESIVRVHRSFLVNLQKVDRITEGYLLSPDFRVPMSKSYQEEVLQMFVKI